jgi:hypothetical protein
MTVRLMMHLLQRAGFVCEHAANGKIAVDLWKHEAFIGRQFDATLMDKVRVQYVQSGANALPCVRPRPC